jgi:hypothetical protein
MSARRLFATVAPKGGIGKTFVAKLLYDLLPTHGRSIAAWDLDAATGTFAVYDDAIKTFDLHAKQESYSWLDDCYRNDIDDVIIDVPGGRIDDLLRTFGDNSVAALVESVRKAGREFVVINPIGVMIAETVTAQVVLNAFAGTVARVVVAKNGRFGDEDDFVIYDGIQYGEERRYGATGDLAKEAGAETVFIPSLAPRLLAQIDAERLRLKDAASGAGAGRIGRLGSARAHIYLGSVVEALRGTSAAVDGVIPDWPATR